MSKLHQIISCHAIAISLFLVAVTAFAEPSSSLTLRFGPAFQSLEAESVQVRAEPAYTFSVQSFQQSTQGTQVQIRVAGPASPPAVFPPEIICFCGSLPGAASVSDFSFAFPGASSLPVSFLATSAGLFIGPPSPFQGSIDQIILRRSESSGRHDRGVGDIDYDRDRAIVSLCSRLQSPVHDERDGGHPRPSHRTADPRSHIDADPGRLVRRQPSIPLRHACLCVPGRGP